jgi:hypothetical protein
MAFENPFTALKDMPKPARYAVLAGVTGVTAFLLYSHHKNTGSWNPWKAGTKTTSGGQAADINPVTGLAYSQDNVTDPITGETYLAEAQQYGSVQAAEAAVSAYGLSTGGGSGIPVNPVSPPPAGSPNTVVGGSVYTSNSAWAQAATAGLTDIGYDGTAVAAALGAYLTGQPVTADQAKIINAAIAEFGPPPIGNFQVILQPPIKPTGPPVPATIPKVTVPKVTGKTWDEAALALYSAHLVPRGKTTSRLAKVKRTSPAAGTKVSVNSNVIMYV